MSVLEQLRRGQARRGRFGAGRRAASRTAAQVQGRWSLTGPLLAVGGPVDPGERRRAIGELLLERYGIVTREQVLAEGIDAFLR